MHVVRRMANVQLHSAHDATAYAPYVISNEVAMCKLLSAHGEEFLKIVNY